MPGGSNYSIADTEESNLSGQLAFAPIALLTAMFRPFLFEVRNPMMLLAALETTALLVLTIRALAQQGWRSLRQNIVASPALMFFFAFSFVFGIAVGLATTNMGTLSRYRVPMLPFFTAAIFVLSWRAKDAHPSTETEAEGTAAVNAVPRTRLSQRGESSLSSL